MYGNPRVGDAYWTLTPKQRADMANFRKEQFFYDRLYKDREKGFFSGEAWSAWWQHTEDWIEEGLAPLGRTRLSGGSVGVGSVLGGIIGLALGPAGVALGSALGAGIGGYLGAELVGPSTEEVEAIGMARVFGPRTRLVDTQMAATMRQRTLSAMHNSVYSLRGALGNEASLMHR